MTASRIYIPDASTLLIFTSQDPIKHGDPKAEFNMWMSPYYRAWWSNQAMQDASDRKDDEGCWAPQAAAVLACWSYNRSYKFHVANLAMFDNYRTSIYFQELKRIFPGITLRGDSVVFEEDTDMVMFRMLYGERQ